MALPNVTIQNPGTGRQTLALQNPETGEHISLQMSIQATDAVSATKAEAYAVGERNGVPVESGDPTYQNNAKYYRDQMREIIDEAQTEGYINVVTAVADAYSASKTYNVGDYATHDGKLHRCIVKITTAEAWTSAHWTQVTVGEDLSKTVWNEVQNLTTAQQSAARNNIKAADEATVAFHTTQISSLETGKQDKLTFDSTPTAGSSNPVTSAGIKTVTDALAGDVGDVKRAFTFQTSNKIDVEQGYYAVANGGAVESDTWCRTDFINRDTVLKSATVKMYLLAYNLNGSYVGGWNGSVFSTTFASSAYLREIIAHDWLERYPNYKFRVDYTASGTLTPADVLADITVEHLTDIEIDHAENAIGMMDKTLSTDAVGTGYGINAGNGNTTSNAALSYTAYIDVSKFAYIKYKRILSTASSPVDGIAFYNASKHYVSGVASKSNQESAGYDSELFEVKVPGDAKYVRCSMLTDTETYGAFVAYGIYPICDAIRATDEYMTEIIANNELNYKNLIGMEADVYYPVNIPAGTYVVMSTADGQAIGQSGLELHFYGEDYTHINYWSFTQSKNSRTVTAPGEIPTRYLRWNITPAKDVQVEIGFTKTDYVPYHYPVGKRLAELESNVDSFVARSIFNGEPYEGTYDWQTPVVEYGALFNGVSNVETIGFFTDPHVMGFAGRNEPNMQEYIKKVSRVFRSAPCRNFVCGGDWLNNNTVSGEACYRLGYIKALAKSMLCDCKLVLGNHDTNYQGRVDEESERGTGILTNETIAALMFNDTETGKAYYSFDGTRSKCYVLDTGKEHGTMLDYDWEQLAWLGGKLIEDDADHSIIFLHIITNNGNVQTITSNFATLVEAYNAHTTITLNGTQYDFRNYAGHKCTGKVELWVGGHTHVDSNGTLGGIPYIITASLSYDSVIPLIDLMLIDYDNRVLKTVRVGGTGSNRTIALST